jgi:polyisoprenoid-binding protein YceI
MSLMKLLTVIVILGLVYPAKSQKFSVKSSEITFFSEAPIENITASNHKISGLLDISNNELVFSVPIKDFEFEKSLMKDHFNEKYMETDKYPKAIFQGRIFGLNVDSKERQDVSVIGKLTIHGVTHEIKVNGTIIFVSKVITAESKFKVRLEEYKIKIPQLLWNNIAEEVEVSINLIFIPK